MDKSILKATGIVAIIVGILWCFTIIGVIWGIPCIIGGSCFLDYAKMSDEELISKKNAVLGWSIYFLFTTFISFVLGIIAYSGINDLEKPKSTPKPKKDALREELEELQKLKEDGLITDTEYKKRKAKILDRD